jgi:hypothetical protein
MQAKSLMQRNNCTSRLPAQSVRRLVVASETVYGRGRS